ncbi:copper-transporting P-type ATPase [Macroventuria anomochaeta]|uniref:Copper-transporting P-type ATPase n=1 Tax=Macroventuria anomochaeta TaxID=301207 RepID=A0ACB6S117_9PLEO|nr:copper-transporting P-type ATPase [Macroventuria anomochaeta]KAF2627980.1 copper-transporting P-type ATPase [Macroventuria anomochaeta]
MRKKTVHLERCEQCRVEQDGICLTSNQGFASDHKATPNIATSLEISLENALSAHSKHSIRQSLCSTEPTSPRAIYRATLALSGMTCSSCVSGMTHALKQLSVVHTVNVNLLTNSGVVVFEGKDNIEEVTSTIEDCGFEASVEKLEEVSAAAPEPKPAKQEPSNRWRAIYAIGGMTCGSCVGHVTNTLKPHSWVHQVDVNLLGNSATVIFEGKEHLASIMENIEDAGYTATLESVSASDTVAEDTPIRAVSVQIDGMFCDHCPGNIIGNIRDRFAGSVSIKEPPLSLASPILHIEYLPNPLSFTIRQIFDTIIGTNPAFKPSVYHPPTIEERAKTMHMAERRRTLRHLIVCLLVAIPTFILGIVFMSLVPVNNHVRQYIMEPMVGNATRLGWALFILSIPIYVYSAKSFHIRAFKEMRAMWRPGSRTPIWQRFTHFGSMNMLMSLGTTIAFFASIVELALAATKRSSGSMDNSYFDAVVFLTMFLLIGRFLEALSKAKAGDAVISLGALRPDEAVLVDPTTGDVRVSTDLLEVGDVVRVHQGTSPPFDGIILDGSSSFDESSLTGESHLVRKDVGDYIYSGTVNKAAPVRMKVTTVSGTSMLDQIVNAVREGQTRRAPVERVADTITTHFVPFVILVAIVTWTIWLILGTTGAIPKDWRDEEAGGWALWSLRFAIAVFVIACPCGIGLAAPTALFVGGGLAAKHGILVRGGGEAFQEASSLDCIVFDKTGTLTQGGSPAVTDHRFVNGQDESLTLSVVKVLEENSGHSIAQALVTFCNKGVLSTPNMVSVDEIPGKGLKGTLNVDENSLAAIIGNEGLMADHDVPISPDTMTTLDSWKARGESVALAAIMSASTQNTWQLASVFSISDPLRPEATGVISALKQRGIDVWMLSGDNPTTANAVGAQVGIPATNIIAGVLPDEKAKKIEYLQQTLTKSRKSRLFRLPSLFCKEGKEKRATIAMVGDGINDAPALSTADLSIAIGSGSDIALLSSSFILINSQLTTILTLLDLSRVVFRRVYFNFGWATVYNLVAMPIAAGVLYPITTGGKRDGHGMQSGGKHVRLDPVWASLAMALSSLSVVCSSLALQSRIPWFGFKARKEEEMVGNKDEGDDATQIV